MKNEMLPIATGLALAFLIIPALVLAPRVWLVSPLFMPLLFALFVVGLAVFAFGVQRPQTVLEVRHGTLVARGRGGEERIALRPGTRAGTVWANSGVDPQIHLRLSSEGKEWSWSIPTFVEINAPGRLTKFLDALEREGVVAEGPADAYRARPAPKDARWERSEGWLAQVSLFGVFCAWPFPALLVGAIVSGDDPYYDGWILLPALMLVGWLSLALAIPHRFAVDARGVGMRSFARERWIRADEVVAIRHFVGEEASGTVLCLRGGGRESFDTAFSGTKVQDEIERFRERWGVLQVTRSGDGFDGSPWLEERRVTEGSTRGRGLQKWSRGSMLWSGMIGLTLAIGTAPFILMWALATPYGTNPFVVLAMAVVIIVPALLVVVFLCAASGVRRGWWYRSALVMGHTYAARISTLEATLRPVSRSSPAPRESLWILGDACLLWVKDASMRPYTPAGYFQLTVGIRGHPQALPGLAERVEVVLLGPPAAPWSPGVTSARTRTRPSPTT